MRNICRRRIKSRATIDFFLQKTGFLRSNFWDNKENLKILLGQLIKIRDSPGKNRENGLPYLKHNIVLL